MLITVCRRLARGWPEYGPDAGRADHIDFAGVVQAPATWDAHFAVYYLPEHPHRLDTGAIGWAPQMCLFAIDCDAPDHASKAPGSAWRQEMRTAVLRLFERYPGGYYYTTRGGMRICYAMPRGDDGLFPQIDTPLAARAWRESYRAWLAEVSRVSGIPVKPLSGPGWGLDQACADWTRLYRLPRVRRCSSTDHEHARWCDGTCDASEQQVPEELGDPENLGVWPVEGVQVPDWDISDVTAEYDVGETDDAVVAAAREDLRRLGPAIENQGGNMKTRIAWGILVNDYALDEALARQEMLRYNAQCQPPWSEDALFSTTGPARSGQNWNAPRGRAASRIRLGQMLTQRAATAAPPPAPPRPLDAVRAAIRAARAPLARSREEGELLAAGRLGRALEGRVLPTDEELDGVVAAVAVFVPSLSEDEAVSYLVSLGPEDRVRPVFHAVREAMPPPPDDFVPEFTDDAPPDRDSLMAVLRKDEEGMVGGGPANLELLVRWDPVLHGRLWFDEIQGATIMEATAIPAASGHEARALLGHLDRSWGVRCRRTEVEDTLGMITQTFLRQNPLVDYLEGLRWDGIPRIGGRTLWGKVREEEGYGDGDTPSAGWLVDYLHASTVDLSGEDVAGYVADVGAKWLISAVARALCPGCKVDTVLVLEGSQGRKKSTAFAAIGGEWFFDSKIDVGTKDSYIQVHRAWIYELAELATLARSATADQKAFLSSSKDLYRPPYAKEAKEFERRCVFGATINPESDGSVDYLKDTTGNRRWWPVRVTRDADLGRLKDDRDQLLAEAVHRYRRGERWWFTREEQAVADRAVAQRTEHDEWAGVLREWARLAVLGKTGLASGAPTDRWTLPDIAAAALKIEVRDLPKNQQRIGRALRAAGFIEHRNQGRRVWSHPEFSVPTIHDRPRGN